MSEKKKECSCNNIVNYLLEYTDYLHDTIVDISKESPEWYKGFSKDIDKLKEKLKKNCNSDIGELDI